MSLSPASCWPGPALVSISPSVKWHHCTRALGVREAHTAAPRKPQPEGRSRASPFSSRGAGPHTRPTHRVLEPERAEEAGPALQGSPPFPWIP